MGVSGQSDVSSFAAHVDAELSEAELAALEAELTQDLMRAYIKTNLLTGSAADLATMLGETVLGVLVPAVVRTWLDESIAELEAHLEEIKR